jgi:hypothetical protein
VELEAAWEAVVTQLAKGGWGARLASGSVSMCGPPSARGLLFLSVTVSRRMLALGMSEAGTSIEILCACLLPANQTPSMHLKSLAARWSSCTTGETDPACHGFQIGTAHMLQM